MFPTQLNLQIDTGTLRVNPQTYAILTLKSYIIPEAMA